jgi:hypothetical protein
MLMSDADGDGDNTPGKYRGLMPPWQPGKSGNPRGRPLGSRNKFGEQFVADFYEDWQQHGAAAIVKLREESVRDYLRVAVAILPKELHVKTESIEDLSDNELMDILDTIRALTSENSRTSRKRD